MSCDWHVHCLTCKETCRFQDANHQVGLMQVLIEHAAQIAELDALIQRPILGDISLTTSYGPVDTSFFARHWHHTLVPINEYGGFFESETPV